GVVIDLGGVDGLLHITDISWGRISSPEEVIKIDQKLNVVVLDFDDEKKRISLGLKQLQPHPWDNLGEEIAVGKKVRGKVVTIAEYGVFVEIQPGVEGLIHVSEMSWSQHPKNPAELFKLGDEVEAVILTLDQAERKMSLGIKQLTPDPWTHAAEKYPVGSRHVGVVRNITGYGLFVELEEGIDGMILVQDLSWTKKISHPSEFISKDEKLEVVVLDLDVENRRLRLGHKQLTEDPWDTYETVFPVDSIHEGVITRIAEKSATVELPYGIEGYCPIKSLKAEPGKAELKEGDTAKFKVVEFNKDNRRIVLSHTRVWQDELEKEKEKERKSRKKSAESEPDSVDLSRQAEPDKGTLGELAVLADLKAALEAGQATSGAETAATPSE
ncbi:MAG: S1 RNA-binding domain-containing protein, partial [Bacteroidia bacterium]|nr:S1 RNA-binding domain-containing protein [Bacteroidia bacterium]